MITSRKSGGEAEVDLAGWVATGADVLKVLGEWSVFGTATVGRNGSAAV